MKPTTASTIYNAETNHSIHNLQHRSQPQHLQFTTQTSCICIAFTLFCVNAIQIHKIMFDEEDRCSDLITHFPIGLDLQNEENGKHQKTMQVVGWILKTKYLKVQGDAKNYDISTMLAYKYV